MRIYRGDNSDNFCYSLFMNSLFELNKSFRTSCLKRPEGKSYVTRVLRYKTAVRTYHKHKNFIVVMHKLHRRWKCAEWNETRFFQLTFRLEKDLRCMQDILPVICYISCWYNTWTSLNGKHLFCTLTKSLVAS